MSVAASASDSGDTATSVVVKNCGRNARLARFCACVASGFIELVIERERPRILVLHDLVLYFGPLAGAVDGFGVGVSCLVRLRVHAAMGSFYVVFLLAVFVVGLVKAIFTLGCGDIVIRGTLTYEGMYYSICGGGIGGGFSTLGDVYLFLISVVCVKNSGCSLGDVVWAVGSCHFIRVLAAVASC